MEKIRKEVKDGNCIYQNESGEEISSTYGETLGWITSVNLEPLRDFLNMTFDDDEAQRMAFIAKALLERAEEKIYTADEYITKHYGAVMLIMATHLQNTVEPETILDVVFTPANAKKDKAEVTE